jgi:hypothetical protein
MGFSAKKIASALIGAVLATGMAAAQTTSAVTAQEIEAALMEAGLAPQMTSDARTGAPVAQATLGELTFFVRALDCAGAPMACENLIFFANFDIGRAPTPQDYRTINAFNDRQVFGRAYVIQAENLVGVDYVIDLGGGVTKKHLSQNIGRWTDVMAAFIDNFKAGERQS